jgi:hypothetical protein
VDLPRTPWCCVRTTTGVVVRDARPHIRRESDVEMWLGIGILQNVHESLVTAHRKSQGNPHAESRDLKTRGSCQTRAATMAVSATPADGNAVRVWLKYWRPPSRLRRYGVASFACQRLAWFTEPKLAEGERRMVDQTGIEPVTS